MSAFETTEIETNAFETSAGQLENTQKANSAGKTKTPISFLKSNNNRFYASEFPDWETPTIQADTWWPFDQKIRNYDYKGIYWVSFDVYLSGDAPPKFDWEYNLHMLAATEVYWDGVKLGQNGKPAATKQEEVPGMIWTSFLIPNHLMTPGKHVLKLKASSHYRTTGMKLIKEGWIQPFEPRFRFVSLGSLIPSLLVSISAVVGLYFLMLFFTEGRNTEHLIFFLLLENITLYGFSIQWDHLVGYTYNLEWLNLLMERIATAAILLLMPTYFLFKHNANKKLLWLISAIVLISVLSKILPFFTG